MGVKVLYKTIHKDPSNVPLKPFKEGLEQCPPKLTCPNPKNWENLVPKKTSKYAWNTKV
jgi:hypothetical protein